jgi:hypothetical protein
MSYFGIKKGGAIDNVEFMTTIVRYSIFLLLLALIFFYISYPNLQFICFIMLLILIILGTTFVIRDLALTPDIWTSMQKTDTFSIFTNNSGLLTLFLFAAGFSIIFKIISITLMIAVFNYGRQQLASDNNTSKKLTYDNSMLLTNYKSLSTTNIIMTISLLSIIFITYSSPEVRVVLKNIIGVILSLGILGLSSYEMFYASKFFDIFKNKGLLYEVDSPLD